MIVSVGRDGRIVDRGDLFEIGGAGERKGQAAGAAADVENLFAVTNSREVDEQRRELSAPAAHELLIAGRIVNVEAWPSYALVGALAFAAAFGAAGFAAAFGLADATALTGAAALAASLAFGVAAAFAGAFVAARTASSTAAAGAFFLTDSIAFIADAFAL
jgi:hypothetical protein